MKRSGKFFLAILAAATIATGVASCGRESSPYHADEASENIKVMESVEETEGNAAVTALACEDDMLYIIA